MNTVNLTNIIDVKTGNFVNNYEAKFGDHSVFSKNYYDAIGQLICKYQDEIGIKVEKTVL